MTAGNGKGATVGEDERPAVRAHRALWRHWGTPAAIYGTVVYSSLIAAASVESAGHQSAIKILLFALITVVVFWLAHIFADALAYHGDRDRRHVTLKDSLGHAVFESGGMLEAAVVPSIPLVLSGFGLMPVQVAIVTALWLAVGMLALLGYLAFAVRDHRIWARIVGSAVTALFGVSVVVLEAALH